MQAQCDMMNLQLRVEELQHKYEPKGNITTKIKIMKMKDVAKVYNIDLTDASPIYI